MPIVPIPPDEEARLDVLHALDILDTDPEEAYDQLTRLAAQICGTPIALVTFIDRERQWLKSRFGLVVGEIRRESSFCAHALAGDILVLEDVLDDERFVDNPLVVDEPWIRSYAGVPLRVDGQPVGSLCVIDRRPRKLSQEQLFALRTLARRVEVELALRRSLLHNLDERRKLSEALRAKHELTTLIVHDLKSPLSTVMLGASLLLDHDPVSPEATRLLTQILLGADAMHRLVLDLLDLSRFDEGAMRLRDEAIDLHDLFADLEATTRLRAERQGRSLPWRIPEGVTIRGDRHLLHRVFENLLDNALKFSPPGLPVTVEVRPTDPVVISVTDEGPTLPEQDRERIFERWEGVSSGTSRGLGLSFCRKAIEAHGGSVHVEPGPRGGNAFVVRLPQRGSSTVSGP